MKTNIQWLFFDIGSTLVDETLCYEDRYRRFTAGTSVSYEEFHEKVIYYSRLNCKGDHRAAQEYGLNLPKWNSDQSRYYHIVETSCPMYGIPNSKTDATDIGYMLEYFAWEGMTTVTPTYKERMLKRRYAQDTESADMLDLIYARLSRVMRRRRESLSVSF